MDVSNLIATFHIAILPLVLFFVHKGGTLYISLGVTLLIISVLLDLLEKMFGKKKKMRSFLHPFSDKIVVSALLLQFVLRDSFSVFYLFIFVLRDIIIGWIRIIASRDGFPITGQWYGRSITFFQFALVFALIFRDLAFYKGWFHFFPSLSIMIFLLTITALILALSSVIHYGYVYYKSIRTRRKLGKRLDHEKIVILANKKSGGFKNSYRRHLLKVFSKRRKAPIIYLPVNNNMYEGVEKKIKDFKQVIIAGGDGSFESALNYKPFQNKSLGFFPLGAGNSFYSYFYSGKRFEYLRSRFKFHEINLDVLELEWDSGKVQTTFLGIGVDAYVMKLSKHKKHHTFADYFAASYKATFGPPVHYNFECKVDNKKYHWKNAINLIIGKVPYIGFGIRALLGDVRGGDGLILGTVCVNTHTSTFFNKFLRLWAILITQLALDKAPLLPLKGKVFEIRSPVNFPVQAGGEYLGETKWVKIKVKRKQKVLVI